MNPGFLLELSTLKFLQFCGPTGYLSADEPNWYRASRLGNALGM